MNYILKNEEGKVISIFMPTTENIKRLEKFFNKSINLINKELQKFGYFMDDNNKKFYVQTIFIDFKEEL